MPLSEPGFEIDRAVDSRSSDNKKVSHKSPDDLLVSASFGGILSFCGNAENSS